MKKKKIPTRKCVACQEMKTKKELLRIVRSPEKEIIIDIKGKQSGRGAYICYQLACLNLAKKRKSLERVLEIGINDEIYDNLQMEITKQNDE